MLTVRHMLRQVLAALTHAPANRTKGDLLGDLMPLHARLRGKCHAPTGAMPSADLSRQFAEATENTPIR